MYPYQVIDIRTIWEGYKKFELPATTQKSYYGKAIVYDCHKGVFLQSYQTIVAYIDKAGNFHRLWYGYSRTTSNHIDDFRRLYGMKKISKSQWEKMDVETL